MVFTTDLPVDSLCSVGTAREKYSWRASPRPPDQSIDDYTQFPYADESLETSRVCSGEGSLAHTTGSTDHMPSNSTQKTGGEEGGWSEGSVSVSYLDSSASTDDMEIIEGGLEKRNNVEKVIVSQLDLEDSDEPLATAEFRPLRGKASEEDDHVQEVEKLAFGESAGSGYSVEDLTVDVDVELLCSPAVAEVKKDQSQSHNLKVGGSSPRFKYNLTAQYQRTDQRVEDIHQIEIVCGKQTTESEMASNTTAMQSECSDDCTDIIITGDGALPNYTVKVNRTHTTSSRDDGIEIVTTKHAISAELSSASSCSTVISDEGALEDVSQASSHSTSDRVAVDHLPTIDELSMETDAYDEQMSPVLLVDENNNNEAFFDVDCELPKVGAAGSTTVPALVLPPIEETHLSEDQDSSRSRYSDATVYCDLPSVTHQMSH
ncbi:uncharacterized protein [Watersipora subatra]|uniref:uncharacterized protein n=1 Tax=Watersipora subatra TaxID=2589382 RepID=UPI00355B3E70